MKLFNFGSEVGKAITPFGSKNIIFKRLINHPANLDVVCMYFDPDGLIGFHPTVDDQLFLVVQGEGWVRGEEAERTAITAGQAAFWTAGDWHESGSDEGMTVIIIEGEGLQPKDFMPEL